MSLQRNKNWQDSKRTIQEAISYIYKHSIFNDVTVQVTKDNASSLCFSAHKLILALRSPVFADMLYGSTTDNRNIIPLSISTRSLDILLWYIYNDDIEVDNIEELLESYDAGVLYKISGFPEICVEKILQLSSRLNASNFCSVIKVASHSNSSELLSRCFHFIEKDPEILLLDELRLVSEESFWKMLAELNSKLCPKIVLKAAIKWMIGKKLSDKMRLSFIDFALFSADGFLDIVEEFRDFFPLEESRCILSNLLVSNSSELPPWCKFSRNKEHCVKMSLPLLYQRMEFVKENAVKVQTECSRAFSKISFFSLRGFQQDLLLKVSVQYPSLRLVILELAFGTDYAPVDNLRVELRCNVGPGKKMEVVQHYLLCTTAHYYLLVADKKILLDGSNNSFNFHLSVEAAGLGNWGQDDSPVSNQRYRTATVVSNSDSVEIGTRRSATDIIPVVRLKPFSEWLVLVDPETGEKNFIISALYFDSTRNIQKYMTRGKKLSCNTSVERRATPRL